MTSFSTLLLDWYDQHGRKSLPWQHPKAAYPVWISEIMLQQTQVTTVIPFFQRFIARFPSIAALANAHEEEVLAHWSGLGYYSRALNLHQSAKLILQHHQGILPDNEASLIALPGIGKTTARAILSIAYNQPKAILDGNVKRVLSRVYKIGDNLTPRDIEQQLWSLAESTMQTSRSGDYTQAIMDLGATCCTRASPTCQVCPLAGLCQARLDNKVNSYPKKTIKKPRPHKTSLFFLLHKNRQQIYLEKQPSEGIWPGLWSFPKCDTLNEPHTFLKQYYDISALNIEKIMDIKHSFTHYHLSIEAHSVAISDEIPINKTHWFTAEEALALGLPKPIRDIITYFFISDNKPNTINGSL